MEDKTEVIPDGELSALDDGCTGIRPYCANGITAAPVNPETVKKAIGGDDEAFSVLFMQTYRYVYSIAKSQLNNDEDIYDAIQDTYEKAYANIKRLKSLEAFISWVAKIAKNCSCEIAVKNAPSAKHLRTVRFNIVSKDNESEPDFKGRIFAFAVFA
jgi:hypothetical protein